MTSKQSRKRQNYNKNKQSGFFTKERGELTNGQNVKSIRRRTARKGR